MDPFFSQLEEKIATCVEHIRSRTALRPCIGIVLGSGLSPLAEQMQTEQGFDYADLPFFPQAAAPSHTGHLHLGKLRGVPVALMQGRCHLYEAYTPAEVTFPVRVLHALGCQTLILSCAAGGINLAYRDADICVITDHIDLPGMAGADPLKGYMPSGRPVFTPMNCTYDPAYIKILREIAQQQQIALQEGVYASVVGPSFETPAEIRMLAKWGADLVGMSTTWEAKVAHSLGLRIAALAGVTNMAIHEQDPARVTSEDDIWTNARAIQPKMSVLLSEFVVHMAELRR